MPKVEWDEVADGVPFEYDGYDSSSACPMFDEADGLVHTFDTAWKTPGGEAYIVLCRKEFSHDTALTFLDKEVNCIMCIAEDHDDR